AGKGAVLVTGHFGSWELMGAYVAQHGWPIDYLVGEQHNLKVNKLMNDHRTMFGIGLIELGVAARGVIKAVREGRMVAMLSDQDAGSDGVIVEFLGRPASTPKGPAAFA
ncbi:MAG TPA: lipid A biosynthesis acyltransferase, partial [candidate division Zixibacteria bacterium]|nr:lipid A biosynthesis acyltransferase [candidate division Zixibacteria bacterium]